MIYTIQAKPQKIYSINLNKNILINHKIKYVNMLTYYATISTDIATFFKLSSTSMYILDILLLNSKHPSLTNISDKHIKKFIKRQGYNVNHKVIYNAKKDLIQKRIITKNGTLNYNVIPNKNNQVTILLSNGTKRILLTYIRMDENKFILTNFHNNNSRIVNRKLQSLN